MSNEVEWLWREAVVAYFENQFQRLYGRKSRKHSVRLMGVPAESLKWPPPESRPFEPTCSVSKDN